LAGYSVSSYYWNFADPLSGANTSTISNPTHVFSANGTYTVKLALNYYPCGTDTVKQVITVIGLPTFTVTGKTVICKGEATVLNFNGASTYSINGLAVAQSTAQVQPTVTTVYTLTAKDNTSGCRSLRTITVNVLPCTGLEETSMENGIMVYPNPNTGVFTIEMNEASRVRIINVSGQEVYEGKKASGKTEIDLSFMAKGIYFLELNNQKGKRVLKLILQ
jgi:PKD repeat protein